MGGCCIHLLLGYIYIYVHIAENKFGLGLRCKLTESLVFKVVRDRRHDPVLIKSQIVRMQEESQPVLCDGDRNSTNQGNHGKMGLRTHQNQKYRQLCLSSPCDTPRRHVVANVFVRFSFHRYTGSLFQG